MTNKEGSLKQSVTNLMNEICAHVTSDAIERDGKFYVGYRVQTVSLIALTLN